MGKKVIKVIVDTGVWFETGEVDVREGFTAEGRAFREETKLTKKYRYREVVRGVDEALALRLEDAHVVVIIGDDEDEKKAPAQVAKPDKPARGGVAPSVDDLTK